ncbi:MAG: hypothetical protein HYS18_14835 [Burkholderiales bacterium]|nr:hypothetical protein [Burkholderiales bacterium]
MEIPSSVLTYLEHYAKKGSLLAFWIDDRKEYTVVIVYESNGEYRFECGGYIGEERVCIQELAQADYSVDEMSVSFDWWFTNAPEDVRRKSKLFVEEVKAGKRPALMQ